MQWPRKRIHTMHLVFRNHDQKLLFWNLFEAFTFAQLQSVSTRVPFLLIKNVLVCITFIMVKIVLTHIFDIQVLPCLYTGVSCHNRGGKQIVSEVSLCPKRTHVWKLWSTNMIGLTQAIRVVNYHFKMYQQTKAKNENKWDKICNIETQKPELSVTGRVGVGIY